MTTDTVIITDLHAVQTAATALPPASLLQLIWLASPALPVGGFSYSEGLETLISRAQAAPENIASDSANDLTNDGLVNWLQDQLQLTLARGDLAVIAQAIPAWRSGHVGRITRRGFARAQAGPADRH